MDYSTEELELLDAIENDNIQSVPFDNIDIKQIAKQTREYKQEKKQISINLKSSDLDIIKQKADILGVVIGRVMKD